MTYEIQILCWDRHKRRDGVKSLTVFSVVVSTTIIIAKLTCVRNTYIKQQHSKII